MAATRRVTACKSRIPRAGGDTRGDGAAFAIAAAAQVVWVAWRDPSSPCGYGFIPAKGHDTFRALANYGGGLATMALLPCLDEASAEKLAAEIRRRELH